MTTEDRLRTALHAAADDTEVSPGSFDRIERRTATARRRRRAVGGGLALAALVAVAIGVPVALRDGGEPVQTGPASDTRDTTTTTESPTTTVQGKTPAEPLFRWPASGDNRTFSDGTELIRTFATEYLGVVAPGIEENREDKFTVRPRAEGGGNVPAAGPRTVVEVMSVDGHLVVTNATSPNIRVDNPAFGHEVSSPVTVAGAARNLYEGNVIVEIRDEAGAVVAGTNTTAAGSGPDLAAFSIGLEFDPPTDRGAVVVKSDSGIEGTPEATVVPVTLGSGAPTPTEVTVFLQDQSGDFVPVTRLVPRTTGVLRASLEQQLLGAYPGEQARGLTSPFSEDGQLLRGVTISEDGTAVVDFDPALVDELAGADGAAVLASLDHTVFQFPNVTWVRYSVGGECASFAGLDTELLCERRSRDEY